MTSTVFEYHEETKHHPRRFARSLGYLDWDTQPHPFRYYEGAQTISLQFDDPADSIAYNDLYLENPKPPEPVNTQTISTFFRYALGLSAWKEYRGDRWALRVNPSSGNLHPTEGYAILGPMDEWCEKAGIYHYVSENHSLELRGSVTECVWNALMQGQPKDSFLVALTSIFWREAWKYGERAFRYCQHDTGHALATLRLSAALHGWKLKIIPSWPTDHIATMIGVDRIDDFHEQEVEEPEFIAIVVPDNHEISFPDLSLETVEQFRQAEWFGKANPLSEEYVDWEIIREVASTSKNPGQNLTSSFRNPFPSIPVNHSNHPENNAKQIILQRRSAVAYQHSKSTTLECFVNILFKLLPRSSCPWDALSQPPHIHLAIFVHNVKKIPRGLYILVRDPQKTELLKEAMQDDFLWAKPKKIPDGLPLYFLASEDCRDLAANISCGQDIGGDSFFSLGMISEFAEPITQLGDSFYRNLFWEAGMIGQVLYLEAEAAGTRGTGIGCYFDNPMHELLGLEGNQLQDLYHFTVGIPIEDERLSTLPPYPEEVKK